MVRIFCTTTHTPEAENFAQETRDRFGKSSISKNEFILYKVLGNDAYIFWQMEMLYSSWGVISLALFLISGGLALLLSSWALGAITVILTLMPLAMSKAFMFALMRKGFVKAGHTEKLTLLKDGDALYTLVTTKWDKEM